MSFKTFISTVCLMGACFLQLSAQNVVKDSLEFDDAVATTPAQIIKGHVSGVRVSASDGNINGKVDTYIRGINALRSDSQPVWIIDGVVVNPSFNQNDDAFFQYGQQVYTSQLNGLSFLNPYDIEKIEVLKDLSAASIYGNRAANGVILVTTKRAKEEGLFIKWDSNFMLDTPYSMTDGMRNTFGHNHNINISGKKNTISYAVSAFYRDRKGVEQGNDGRNGGLRVTFDARPNKVLEFGLTSAMELNSMNSISATTYAGNSSMTLLQRVGATGGQSVENWISDYDDELQGKRFNGSAYINLNFTPEFSLKTKGAIDYLNNNRYIWLGPHTPFGAECNGAASILHTGIFGYDIDASLDWDHKFSETHTLSIKTGVDIYGENTRFNTMNGIDYFSPVLRARGLSISSSKAIHQKYGHNYSTLGVYGALAWSYEQILGVNAIVRADNTARYDDGKFTIYKGADLYVDFHNAFFRDSKGISDLKLTAGYGEGGREQYIPAGRYGRVLSGSYPEIASSVKMFYEGLNRLGSSEFNVGFDMAFFSDRIKLHTGYYDKKTDDNFYGYCFGKMEDGIMDYADRQEQFSRSTTIANRGFETDLNFNLVDGPDFKWNLYANVAVNENRLSNVDANDNPGLSIGDGLVLNRNNAGGQVGAFFNGGTNAQTGNGFIGNSIPKVTGGFGSTFEIKNFVIDFMTDGAGGFDIINLNKYLETGVIEAENGDYFKLGRLTVAYDVPMDKVRWIRGIRVNLSAFNLLTATGYSGWNPEVNCFSNNALTRGVDYGSYPQSRAFVLGLSFNF